LKIRDLDRSDKRQAHGPNAGLCEQQRAPAIATFQDAHRHGKLTDMLPSAPRRWLSAAVLLASLATAAVLLASLATAPDVIAGSLPAAADATESGWRLISADPEPATVGEVCVRGRVTDEGIECPAMRGADGRLYTLAGDLAGLAPGAEACICGTVAELSTCMQGTTLAITRTTPADSCK
jgi:hypothetical protein